MNKADMPAPYRWFKSYVRFLTEKVYYRKTYCINGENVPQDGTPLLIVSDHQNSLNDALGILMSIRDRLVHFIVRADVFALSPVADKFLRSIGLLPAFRLNWEGEAALSNNGATFRDSEKSLIEGNTVVIYPEAGHQDRHFLGTFSYGYTKMAFDAAEMGNFEKDVFILPSCNHYSSYNGLRTDMLIKYGTPISLKPYYELYKTKPRTAQRQVNAIIREQIQSMMLDIRDTENYGAIDYIRTGVYGEKFALSQNADPDNLPQRLVTDKRLVAMLDEAKEKDNSEMMSIYREASALEADVKKAGLVDNIIGKVPSMADIILQAAVLVILFPLALFALWPSIPAWFIPKYFSDKAEDKMFSGTFLIALNALFIFPVLGLITLIVTWVKASLVSAIIYVALFPALCLFEWTYCRWVKELFIGIRAAKAESNGLMDSLVQRRNSLFSRIDNIIGIRKK